MLALSLKNYDFERFGNGFQQHVKHEHNMWSYLTFQLHLREKDPNEYTSHEQYFHDMLDSHGEAELFPINHALALQSGESSGVESRLTTIEQTLSEIIHRFDQQVQRETERERREADLNWQRAATGRLP